MKVALMTGHEKIEYKEFPSPLADPGKAVVEISHCGICGTDLHAFHTGNPYNPASSPTRLGNPGSRASDTLRHG